MNCYKILNSQYFVLECMTLLAGYLFNKGRQLTRTTNAKTTNVALR